MVKQRVRLQGQPVPPTEVAGARGRLLGGLVVLLALAAYANSWPGAFILDDVPIVERNPLVHSLDLAAIFTSDYWGVGADRGLYRPLTILSLALNTLALGPDPWSYHLVNVLLHAGVTLLFFSLVRAWTEEVGLSLAAAALFAVHPLHTEVLNEVIGRSELLAALGYLLALRLAHGEGRWRSWGAGGCYLLALLSKEHAVTLLAALPLADAFFRRQWRRRVPLYCLLVAITVAWGLFHVYGVDRGTMGRPPLYPIYSPLAFMPTGWRLLTALKMQLLYLQKLAWPLALQGVYSGPQIETPVTTLASSWGLGIVVVIVAVVGLTVLG